MGETLADQDSTPICALKKEGPIMDTVLSFLISAGIFAFGVWVVAGTIAAGWPLTSLMGLLAAIVGLLSLFWVGPDRWSAVDLKIHSPSGRLGA
jgi:hypothetical protein